MPTTKKRSKPLPSSSEECSCLKDALILIEKQQTIQELADAKNLFQRVLEFPVATVLLASKVSDEYFAELEGPSSKMKRLLEDEGMAQFWKKLQLLRRFPCCRGPASGKYLPSSRIIDVVAPLMRKKRLAKKKMSALSPMIEILLQFTEVVLDQNDNVAAPAWDEVQQWISDRVNAIPLLAKILDPVYLIIRGNNGAPGPLRATLERVLTMIAVGRDAGGYSVAPTPASMEVVRPEAVGYVRIPDMYRFYDLDDARVARLGLLLWASQQVPVVQLDIVRMDVGAVGFTWL